MDDLIIKAKTDDKSLEAVLNLYAPVVRGIARKYFLLGGEQEDLVQEGMVALYHAIITFDEKNGASFKTYAKNCISNKIISAIKTANRQKNTALNQYTSILEELDEDEDGYIIISDDLTPEENYIRRQRNLLIVQKLKEELSFEQLKILSMYLQGEKYTNIASAIDKTVKHVDNQLYKIKKVLSNLKENIK